MDTERSFSVYSVIVADGGKGSAYPTGCVRSANWDNTSEIETFWYFIT